MPTPVRMVCFDAGGVLVRICRSWREGCQAAGVEFRWNEQAEGAEQDRARINEAYQRGEIGCDQFFEQMAATSGGLYTPEEILTVHDAWILDEYPGVRVLIDALNRTDGLTTGLLSNTSARHWAQPLMLGGRGVSAVGSVAHPHASHLLGLTKPGVAIYREFERQTGCMPAEIIFFDDLPENVAAARAAGWRAERIDHAADTETQIRALLRSHQVVV